MPVNRFLIESKYAVAAAVVGFLLALALSHGSLMAGLGVLALVAGIGWSWRLLSRRREEASGVTEANGQDDQPDHPKNRRRHQINH